MSYIVYQKNKKTGITYAYESVSYWDKEKQQPRSKRKYIGRVDPETGEIVISRKNRKTKAEPSADASEELLLLRSTVEKQAGQISALQTELERMTEKYDNAVSMLRNIASIAAAFQEEE